MIFLAGMGMYDLTEFAEWVGEGPRGWVDVGLEGVGKGGENVLMAMVVQVRVCENHQNGKDTHVRGVQIFARDGRRAGTGRRKIEDDRDVKSEELQEGIIGLEEADWMGEPELR